MRSFLTEASALGWARARKRIGPSTVGSMVEAVGVDRRGESDAAVFENEMKLPQHVVIVSRRVTPSLNVYQPSPGRRDRLRVAGPLGHAVPLQTRAAPMRAF